MNNVVDITQSKPPELSAAEQVVSAAPAILALPFVFAKRNGVLVGEATAEHIVVLTRPGASSTSMAEVRRFLAKPVIFETIDADEFDARLQKAYEQHSGEAMQ